MSVAERRAKAARELSKLAKKTGRAASPVVLTFHDFRGLPGHRLDFTKIVNTLTQKDRYTLVDFDADAAVAASRYRAPDEQTYEDLQDLLKVWRQRMAPSLSR